MAHDGKDIVTEGLAEQRAFSAGNRVQITAPSSELKLANRELGTVERIGEGRMSLKLDDGRTVELDPTKHPHLDHGYACARAPGSIPVDHR